ncbi:hypothetical protein AB0K43_14490 [Kitasatospora sp. NPDC049258]|uniref:hypothetical protein n=1 Tax=Kitasatospora sp. NPDC049258 TaxID=3155394 RepID=UPI0034440443
MTDPVGHGEEPLWHLLIERELAEGWELAEARPAGRTREEALAAVEEVTRTWGRWRGERSVYRMAGDSWLVAVGRYHFQVRLGELVYRQARRGLFGG